MRISSRPRVLILRKEINTELDVNDRRLSGGIPFVAFHIVEKRAHGRAGKPTVRIVQEPAWQGRAPADQELNQQTAFNMRFGIVIQNVSNAFACQGCLKLIVSRIERQASLRRDIEFLASVGESPCHQRPAWEPPPDTIVIDKFMRGFRRAPPFKVIR